MDQYRIPKALALTPEFGGLRSIQVAAGNFGMAMNGTHYFEMFRYMCDEPPDRVSAWISADTNPNPRGAQFVDSAGCVRLTTSTGRRFYMDCSGDQGHGMQVVYLCRNGRITVDELSGRMTAVHRRAEHRDLPTTRYGMPEERYDREIAPADALQPTRAVLEALLAGDDFPTGEEGLLAMGILVAARVSAERNGIPVDLPGPLVPRTKVLPIA